MVLEYLRLHFRRLGFFDWNSSPRGKQFTLFLNVVILPLITVQDLSNLCELLFFAKTFDERAMSFIFTAGPSLPPLWYINCIRNSQSYANLFDQLNTIVEKRCRNPVSKKIYDRVNHRIETLTKWLLSIIIAYTTSFILLAFSGSVYKYISSDGDRDSFSRAFPTAVPFDWRTPTGYLAVTLLHLTLMPLGIYTALTVIVLNWVCCIFIKNLALDIKQSLRKLNDELSSFESSQLAAKKKANILHQLNEIIRFHVDVRHFTFQFSNTGRIVVFSYLVFALVSTCNILVQINRAMESGHYSLLIEHILIAILIISLLYLLCHFGDLVTQCLEELEGTITHLAWHYLPIKSQKDLILPIALSQRSIYIEGLAGARCTRFVFMRIMNKTLSTFMVLREF